MPASRSRLSRFLICLGFTLLASPINEPSKGTNSLIGLKTIAVKRPFEKNLEICAKVVQEKLVVSTDQEAHDKQEKRRKQDLELRHCRCLLPRPTVKPNTVLENKQPWDQKQTKQRKRGSKIELLEMPKFDNNLRILEQNIRTVIKPRLQKNWTKMLKMKSTLTTLFFYIYFFTDMGSSEVSDFSENQKIIDNITTSMNGSSTSSIVHIENDRGPSTVYTESARDSNIADINSAEDPNTADIESARDYIDILSAAAKPELEIDKAWFTVNSSVNHDIEIWAQSDECYKCDLMFIETVPGESTLTILVNTSFYSTLKLVRVHPGGSPKEVLCHFHTRFREEGNYWVFFNYQDNDDTRCNLILANDPPIAELPILFVFLGLILLATVYALGKRLVIYARKAGARRQNSMDINTQSDPEGSGSLSIGNGKTNKDGEGSRTNSESEEQPKKRARLRSLDVFRGLTLTLMIFVNYGGGRYWFFEHAAWNGIYVADLVFPWFVFIMGVSLTFSFRSMFKKDWSAPQVVWRVVWRSSKLFVLGFMWGTVHWVADVPNVRVLGVLQRLALTYLISSLLHFAFARKVDSHQEKRWSAVRDIFLNVPEWLANVALLGIHLGVIYALPVTGCPTGYVGPGGLSESGKFWNCTGGATQYVDAWILGEHHMYQWPTPQVLYQSTVPFDPEGMLGTLGCVFMCFLGIQCGRILLVYQDYKQRIIRFLIWALILGSLGALLSKCSQDDGWIPSNKNIWSLSYTLITACFAYVLMTVLYLVVDVFRLWPGQPFIYPGMNSIIIYLCHGIFYKTFPISWEVEEIHWKILLQHVWGTAAWVLVSYWLFVKKIFIAL